MNELVTKVRNLMKVYKNRSDTETFKLQVMQFDKQFDICSCPCFANFETIPQSKEISTQLCSCNPRIPINQFDIHFYLDQMGLRVKFIGPVNFRETQLESRGVQKDIQESI